MEEAGARRGSKKKDKGEELGGGDACTRQGLEKGREEASCTLFIPHTCLHKTPCMRSFPYDLHTHSHLCDIIQVCEQGRARHTAGTL